MARCPGLRRCRTLSSRSVTSYYVITQNRLFANNSGKR